MSITEQSLSRSFGSSRLHAARALCGLLALATAACEADGSPLPPSMDAGPASGCAACAGDELCVDGACTPVPSSCPCPAGAYCDLATDTCVRGCLEDADCGAETLCQARSCVAGCRADADCASGRICVDELCRAGCRRDADCPGRDAICDPSTMTCRGCRADDDCALEQICVDSLCTPACRDDARCAPGRICDEGLCRDGCRSHDDCPLGTYCSREGACTEGCGEPGGLDDSRRCPVGQACVVLGRSEDGLHLYGCRTECGPADDCHRSSTDNYVCFDPGEGPGRCREVCSEDGDCAAGQICLYFTLEDVWPTVTYRFCGRPCASDAECAETWNHGGRCTCRADGQCSIGTSECFAVSPSHAL